MELHLHTSTCVDTNDNMCSYKDRYKDPILVDKQHGYPKFTESTS